MLQFGLEADFDIDVVATATAVYGRNVERDAAEEAARIMRSNIRIVPRSTKPSPPGGFPYSRTGELPNSIGVSETDEGYVVGPPYRQPEGKYSLSGADTIAQLINDGGVLITRRRIRRKGSRFSGQVSVRAQYRPRPYIELTLDILADRLPDIASNSELN